MSPMRDIYLIAKFSNMDIIILFLFDLSTSFPPASRSTLCPPKPRFVVQNIPFFFFVTY